DGKDSAVGARQQSIVNGELIGKVAASTSGADGVNVAENVRDGHVGRGQFFHVTLVTRQPGNGSVFALRSHLFAAGAANGPQRVIVNFAAGNHGDFRVEQLNQAAKDAALGLAAQPQQNKIMAREQCVHDLRNHTVLIAVHAREKRI